MKTAMAIKITSPSFEHGKAIPAKYTCDGENVNPALDIAGVPDNAKSLVLIMDDPDAPSGTWVHWVVYDIPVTSKIDENSVPGKQGITSSKKASYGGPCPPSGSHRYFFKIYALDTTLNLSEGKSRQEVASAMKGHVIAEGELMGRYARKK